MSAAILGVIPLAVAWVLIGTRVQLSNPGAAPLQTQNKTVLVAIGDSFMSGEGTDAYLPGTAMQTNLCHRSALAYPPQVAAALGMQLAFAACSGATTHDMLGGDAPEPSGQYPMSPDDVPGARPQIELLERSAVHASVDDVGIVLLSIGGNDAHFGEIVRTCLVTNCEPMWGAWMDGLAEAGQRIGEAHAAVARKVTKNTRVLVTLYPEPIMAAACGPLGEQLSRSEVSWVIDTFLTRLNYVIAFWARHHGFEVVDLSRTFEGARICEVPYDQAAANAFNLRRNDVRAVKQLLGSSAQGSFHPNLRGHSLMKDEVLASLRRPRDDHGQIPPWLNPFVPAEPFVGPVRPMTPPPHIPTAVGLPREAVPAGLTCRGVREEFTKGVGIHSPTPFYRLVADPGSAVCYRAEHHDWVESVIPANGIFEIPLSAMNEGGLPIEVWYSEESKLAKLALLPQFNVPARAFALGWSVSLGLAGAIGVMLLATGHQVYCVRCRRRTATAKPAKAEFTD